MRLIAVLALLVLCLLVPAAHATHPVQVRAINVQTVYVPPPPVLLLQQQVVYPPPQQIFRVEQPCGYQQIQGYQAIGSREVLLLEQRHLRQLRQPRGPFLSLKIGR